MLGTGTPKNNNLRQKAARKTRLKTINVTISMPQDGSTSGLAGRIRDSVNRTLAREGADACSVTMESEPAPAPRPRHREEARQSSAPVGCGAWWNF